MNATRQRMTLAEATAAAEKLYALVGVQAYVDWVFAGSIRRRAPSVGDIDHVVLPAFAEGPRENLFLPGPPENQLWKRLDELTRAGQLKYAIGGGGGDRKRIVELDGHKHEIWTARPDTWGIVLLIRTGPGDFSKRFVTDLRKHGCVAHDGAVWRLSDNPADHTLPNLTDREARQRGLWIRDEIARGVQIPTPTEHDVFRLIGWSDIKPEDRR